jgi:hypothetical protein
MLEPKRDLSNLLISELFDKSWLVSMDVIILAQLSCKVVSPQVHMVLGIDHSQKSSSKRKLIEWEFKECLSIWLLSS